MDYSRYQISVLRAGELNDRALYYRHDLAFADGVVTATNPHAFTFGIDLNIRLQAQAKEQVGRFFQSDVAEIIQLQPSRYFEFQMPLPLPEDLNYLK